MAIGAAAASLIGTGASASSNSAQNRGATLKDKAAFSGLNGYVNIAGKKTYTDKKYGIMQNIFDPGGQTGLWDKWLSKGEEEEVEIPTYYLDPYYDKTQSQLYDFSSGLLSGDVNDYYKAIGMIGSPEFEDMLALGKRDIMKAGNESVARLGIRGGRAAGAIAGSIADYETKNRYADYERALAGKQFLMSTGISGLSDVRSGALTQSEMLNNFNQNNIRLQLGLSGLESDAARAQGESQGSMISALMNAYGAYTMDKGSSTGDNSGISYDYSDYGGSKAVANTNVDLSDYYSMGSAS